MKEKNNKIVILLVIVIIALSIMIGLLLTGTISLNKPTENNSQTVTEENGNSQNTSYTYKNLKGLYTYTSEKYIKEQNETQQSFDLYLYENGTYVYRQSFMITMRYFGNYTIVDNKIILNNLFTTNSGTGINVSDKENLLTIEIRNNNTLVDNSISIDELNLSNITLTKVSESQEKEFLENNDFINLLNNDEYINNYTKTKNR